MPSVGELTLVAGEHQALCLGHDLRLALPRVAQVVGDEYVGGEQDHVLLAAAEGHLQQALQPVDGLGQEAACHGDQGAGRVFDGVGRHRPVQGVAAVRGKDHVLDQLLGNALGFDQHLLDHRVGGIGAAGRDLQAYLPHVGETDAELGPADVVGAEGDRPAGLVQQFVPVRRGQVHLDRLWRVQVVVQGHLGRKHLAPDAGEGQVHLEEEGLEDL